MRTHSLRAPFVPSPPPRCLSRPQAAQVSPSQPSWSTDSSAPSNHSVTSTGLAPLARSCHPKARPSAYAQHANPCSTARRSARRRPGYTTGMFIYSRHVNANGREVDANLHRGTGANNIKRWKRSPRRAHLGIRTSASLLHHSDCGSGRSCSQTSSPCTT